jgi:hypothetical protein
VPSSWLPLLSFYSNFSLTVRPLAVFGPWRMSNYVERSTLYM